ncbi:MAG TPA: FGGY family carbohydrate kinase [Gammaproteobacteria bacterium]|nr:FGGY family carbohydrate kinase [Gammaproteobacteria bacterium]
MARRCVLALDQGGHASRALLFDAGGAVLAHAERRIATHRRGPARVEHTAAAVLRSLQEAAEAAIEALPRGWTIEAAGLATQRSSIACWDRASGKPLSPVISWQDRRAARRVTALAPEARRITELTGLVLSPHYGASKLAWCLQHLPAVKKARREGSLAAGPLASFAIAGLVRTRPCLADPVNGARTQLLDIHRGDWSQELGGLFEVPVDILPRLMPNRHAFGELRIVGRPIPLTVVTGDQPAALFADGEPKPHVAYLNLGTGAFIQCLSEQRVPGLLRSVLWRDTGRSLYALEGTVNGAATALNAIGKRLGLDETRMMRALPAWLAASSEPPLFLNGIGGLGAPYWCAGFSSRFVGRGDAGRKMTAVVESIVFLLLENLERMRSAGIGLRTLRVSGGLAQLDGLCQRLADLSALPVERPALHEATALGLARLAGGAAQAPTADCSRFEPRHAPLLGARQRRWQAAMHEALEQDEKKRPG